MSASHSKNLRPNILHILTSHAWGGLETYTLDFIQKLIEEGLNCSLLCAKNSKVEKEAKTRNIPIIYKKKLIRQKKWSHLHVHQRQDLKWIRFLLLGKSTPLFYSLYMSAPPKKDFFHKWIYGRIQAIVSSSELLNQEIEKNFPIKKDRIKLIRYGRNNPNLKILETTRLDKKDSLQKIILGTMCRIDPGKGVQDILEASKKLSPEEKSKIEIWIIGDPTLEKMDSAGNAIYEKQSLDLYNELQKEASKTGSGLKLLPYQKNDILFLNKFDAFILATVKETYSLAVIDSMLLGKPVIGTKSGGTIEQIGLKEERGLFILPNDSESILWAIRKILQNPSLLDRKGEAAKTWALSEHLWDKCLAKWKNIYGLGSSHSDLL